ncbi:MAG TPA: winged helix-turn-helix domain-containing protein [Vicinamibacteria bacterium]|nr:winged helix-turn-helix domain-containing protein [Vicinamibacteria bacterium]
MTGVDTHARARFGTFELDRRTGELRKDGRKVKLQEQPFRILELLLADPGEVVTREQLRSTVWPADTFVDFDDGLNSAIRKLRQALDDSAENPRFVETLPKRGYRFIAPVAVESGEGEESAGPARAPMRAWRPAPWTRLLVGLIALAAVAVSAAVWWPQLQGFRPVRSIAVLPLENLSRDPDQEYFADGMTDELITNLAQIPSLRVMSRSATMPYKRARKSVREIARDLNVDAVVEGSVLRSGSHVRITAQLIQGATDHHLWAQSYERDAREVLTLQREVADAIAQQVRARTAASPPTSPPHTLRSVNPQAHEWYLLGLHHSRKRDGETLTRSIECFEKAIAMEPGFAPAYAGLAGAYRERDVWAGLGVGTHARDVRAAALKAIELDDTLAEAHYQLGAVHFQYDWDWPGTEAEYRRALELNPNLAAAHSGYAFLFQSLRRHAEAIAAAKRATELDPLSPTAISDEGRMYYRARQYDRAIERYQRALEFDATFRPALSRLAEAYALSGRYAESLATLDRLRLVHGPGEPLARPLGRLYSVMGRKAEALAIAHQIEEEGVAGGEPFALAVIYTGLGDYDRALTHVERGVAARSMLPFTLVDPMLDPLQTLPRFKALLARMNLPLDESAR